MPAAAQQTQPAVAATGAVGYTIFLRGTPVGREDVSVRSDATGTTVVTEGRISVPANIVIRRGEFRYGPDWTAQSFALDGTGGGAEVSVRTSFTNGTAVSKGVQGPAAIDVSHTVSPQTIILPNTVFAGYVALARRLTTLPAGSEFRVYVLPSAEIGARVASIATEQIQIGAALLNVRRYELTFANPGGDLPITLTATDDGALVRLNIPSAGIDVVREDVAASTSRTQVFTNPGDEPVTIPAVGFNIGATLTRPRSGPFDSAQGRPPRLPAVVLLSGSGVPDRDGFALGIPTLGQLAGALAEAGFLAVRYDKRGFGQSGGRGESATIADYAEDARAVVRWLAARRDVDPKRIAVVGHSEGAWVALLAASRENRIAAVVSIAGAAGTGAALVLEQQQYLLEQMKLPPDEREAKVALQKQIHSAVLTGKGWESVTREQRRAVDTPWFQHFLAFDPVKALEDVDQPLLFVHGALDRQVPVAHADRLADLARTESDSKSVEVVIVRGVNHLLAPATTGDVNEYATLPDRNISADVKTAITSWLAKTFKEIR